MKKILLFLLLITYSFSIDGFGELKWESTPEDFYKYYGKYNYKPYHDNSGSVFTLINSNLYFEGEKLNRIDFIYNYKKFAQWLGKSEVSKEKAEKIYNKYRNKYNPEEEMISNNQKSFIVITPESKNINVFYITLTEYNTYSIITYSFLHAIK